MFTGKVKVKVASDSGFDFRALDSLSQTFRIVNDTGTHDAELCVFRNYTDRAIYLGGGNYCASSSVIKAGSAWVAATVGLHFNPRMKITKTFYGIRVLSDRPEDRHYVLSDTLIAQSA